MLLPYHNMTPRVNHSIVPPHHERYYILSFNTMYEYVRRNGVQGKKKIETRSAGKKNNLQESDGESSHALPPPAHPHLPSTIREKKKPTYFLRIRVRTYGITLVLGTENIRTVWCLIIIPQRSTKFRQKKTSTHVKRKYVPVLRRNRPRRRESSNKKKE